MNRPRAPFVDVAAQWLPQRPACELLGSLEDPRGSFQPFALMERNTQSGESDWRGYVSLLKLPHIHAQLSREVGGGRKLIDPPTKEAFLKQARAEYDKGELSWSDFHLLSFAATFLSEEDFLFHRNRIVMERVDAIIPGSFTRKPQKLHRYPPFQKLVRLLPPADLETWILEGWLTKTYHLNQTFTEDSGGHRREILQALVSEADDPKELGCQWVLHQRLLAQWTLEKGIYGLPDLKPNGTLRPIPLRDKVSLPEFDQTGIFPQIVTEDWLHRNLKRGRTRPLDTPTTLSFLKTFRGVLSELLYRESTIWAPEGLWSTPVSILRTRLGMTLVMLSTLEKQELILNPGARSLELRENSTEGLSELTWLVSELHTVFHGLKARQPWESGLLKGNEEELLFGPGGVAEKLEGLTQLVIFAAIDHLQKHDDPASLRRALRRLGEVLSNDSLKNY